MDKINELGTEKVGRLLWKYSVPPVIGMMIQGLYFIVDRFFVGQAVGAIGNSAISIVFPVIIISMAFSMLVGFGATSAVSIALGEKRRDYAGKLIGNAFVINTIITFAMILFAGIFMDEMIIMLGGNEEIMEMTKGFLSILLVGAFFGQTGFAMNNMIRALGSPTTSMTTMLIGAPLNMILNPIFIYGFGMGIKGSALATVISQFVSCAWVTAFYFGKKNPIGLHLNWFKPDMTAVKRILSLGAPSFVVQIGGSVIATIFNHALGDYGGTEYISLYGIISSIVMFIMMPVFGVTQGAQPIIGYNFGAKQYDRVRQAVKSASFAVTVICTVGFIIVMAGGSAIISPFVDGNQLIASAGGFGLRVFCIFLPAVGLQVILSSYFNAVGKPTRSIFLTLLRQVILLIPLLLIMPHIFQMNGIWISVPMADMISVTVTIIFMLRELKHLNSLHESAPPAVA